MKKTCTPLLVFIAIAAIICLFSGFAAKPIEERYKDWNYSPSGVFGLVKLENTTNRSYYKLSHIDAKSTRIQEYNAAGIVVYTTIVRFFNGKLNMMTSTDQWGNTYEMGKYTYIGNDEFNVTRTNTGKNSYLPCKSARYIYKNNLLVELRFLSYSGKLCENSNGVAIIKYKRYEDKDRFSLIKEQAFFGADGQPVISKSFDCHKVVYDRDDRGNDLSAAYFGTNDEPLTNRYGGFKNKYTYDDNDNYITWENVGLNEEPTLNAYGCAKTSARYQNGFRTLETRYDDKNTIVKASAAGDGVAIIRNEYDTKGNITQISYYDENNQAINSTSGYHKIGYKYSPLNMLISIEYFDQNDAPVADASGIHRYSYVRDDKGRVVQDAYFDIANNPVQDKRNVVYMIKYKYDELGRVASTSYWKDNVTKMQRWNGYHEDLLKYNQDGQENERIYLDENGNLIKTGDGYSRQVINYNADASIAERAFFDNNTPVVLTTGAIKNFHRIKYAFDGNGRVTNIQYFDENDKPANVTITFNEEVSCQKIEFVYQGNRIIQENCYLANNNTPNKVIDCLKSDYVNTNGVNKGHKNQ